jgi:hypothetical protein
MGQALVDDDLWVRIEHCCRNGGHESPARRAKTDRGPRGADGNSVCAPQRHPLEHDRRDSNCTRHFITGFSLILTGLNFIVTAHRRRAAAMTRFRMPLFL